MTTIEFIDYENIVTLEEGEIVYVSLTDWDVPAGITTDVLTEAGSLIVALGAGVPAETGAPGADDLVWTSKLDEPKKGSWQAKGGGGGDVDLINKSGSNQVAGTVVIFDADNDDAFKLTTIYQDRRVAGVLSEDIANNATGKVAVGAKKATVKVQGNVNRGQWLIASATTGRAQAAGYTKPLGAIGMALTAYSGGGAGTVEALIAVDHYQGAGASKGYSLGGSNNTPAAVTTTQALAMASETVAIVAGAALGAVRASCAAAYTSDKGITYGGTNTTAGTGAQVTAYRTTFSTEVTAAVSSADLPAARSVGATISAPLAGYFVGGWSVTPAVSNTGNKTPWSTETTAALASSNLSVARGFLSGMVHSTTHGYVGGGENGSAVVVNTTDRLVIATDTTAALASGNLSAAREGAAGTINSTQGYWSGGTTGAISTTTDKLPFSTETTAAVGGAALSTGRKQASGNSGVSGYVLGGSTVTTIGQVAPGTPISTTDKLSFSSDTMAAASGANLVTALSAMASMSA